MNSWRKTRPHRPDGGQAKTHGWEIEVGGRITPEWQIQAGYSQSKTRDQDGSRQKAYAVADIMARYRFNPHAELSLNVDNLFNKHYRTQPDRHSYGALRTVNAAFTYRFK